MSQAQDPPEVSALWAAVERGDVTFHQVSTAWFESRFTSGDPSRNGRPDDATREAYARVFPKLLEVFGEQRGCLISAYFCRNIRVGVALTDIAAAAENDDGPLESLEERQAHEQESAEWGAWKRFRARRRNAHQGEASNTAIHLEPIFGDPDSPRAKELLFRCLRVHYHALEFLKPKPRKICMRMTFNVITMLLGTLDTRAGNGGQASAFDQSPEDQRTIEKELESTESYFLQSAQRTARLEYLIGMIPGLILAALVAVLIWNVTEVPQEFSIALVGGALGALVSVMERLTAGKLTLNHEYGKATLRILGGMRPFIGALFGLALYVLISGALIPMEVPDGDRQRYFFAGIAFLAGFSERWAQDMIDPGKLPTPTAHTTATAPAGARPPALVAR